MSDSRVKTRAELDQEERDAALARQLQMEADVAEAQYQQQQQQRATQPSRGNGAGDRQMPGVSQQQLDYAAAQNYPGNMHTHVAPRAPPPPTSASMGAINPAALPHLSMPHVRCTKCNAINTVQPDKMHLQQICGQCQKLLPPTPQQQGMQQFQQQQQQPRSAPPPSSPPQGYSGAGGNSASAIPPPAAPRPADNAGGGGAPVLQGQVQSVQARCGQCQAINALPIQQRTAGTSISFKCGQCQAINKVTM